MKQRITLFDRLSELAEQDRIPMHMPGHKRNPQNIGFLEKLGARYDITEIQGFDNLHDGQGLLKECMTRAAGLWQSDRSFFLINGSTGGILSAVRAATKTSKSDKIIMARNCHKSVYNAVDLCGMEPVYITPPTVQGYGFCGSINPKTVEAAVTDNPGSPVILTSPTYEGVTSNIADISIICHERGSPLIVDAAHGAHLDLSEDFAGGAVRAGADLVVQSVHKTLTGLTQTGILHLCGNLISAENVMAELSVFQSTSPSYLLMASIDGTVDLIESRGSELLGAWKKRLDAFDEAVQGLKLLKIPGHSEPFKCQTGEKRDRDKRLVISGDEVYGYDRSKIVISCEGTNLSGVELMRRLYTEYGIECEMAAGGYCVAMTGLLDKSENVQYLAKALTELDGKMRYAASCIPMNPICVPPRRMSAAKAMDSASQEMPLHEAAGCIAAEYIYAYPPGIPIVVPGEELTGEIISMITVRREAGVALKSTSGKMPECIRIVT